MDFLDELLVALGFEYDPEGLEDFKKDVTKTTTILKSLVKVVTGTAAAITGMVAVSSKLTDEQGKFGNEVGLSVERVDALQQALVLSGGSSDGMKSSLRSLTTAISEANRGVGGGIEAFSILGIEVTNANGELRKTDEVLIDVSKRIQGLDKARQIDLAGKLGLTDSIRLLQQGPAAIQALTRSIEDIGVSTEEDARIAADFNDSLTLILQVVKQITRVMVRTFGPILTEMNQKFVDWWKANRELIEQNMGKWITQAAAAFKLLTGAIALFLGLKLAGHLLSFISLLKAFSTAALAAQLKLVAIPLLILGLFLLIEDAMGFFDGKESLFGDLLKDFPEQEKMIRSIANAFASLGEAIKIVISGWEQLFKAFSDFNFDNIGQTTKDIFGFLGSSAQSALGFETNFERVGREASSTTNSNVRVDKIDITVPGAGDAEGVAQRVLHSFQQSIQDLESAVFQ